MKRFLIHLSAVVTVVAGRFGKGNKLLMLAILLLSASLSAFADGGLCRFCSDRFDELSDCCHACDDCIEEHGIHCCSCNECMYETQDFCSDPAHGMDLGSNNHCNSCAVKCSVCDQCFYEFPEMFCTGCDHCFRCAIDDLKHCEYCASEEGGFEMNDIVCDYCGLCRDCLDEAELHCPECDACGPQQDEPFCDYCGLCIDCQMHCPECGECIENVEPCEECNMCVDCALEMGLHCINCIGISHAECEECQMCLECAIEEGLHCPLCSEHTMEDNPCPSDGEHCAECCVVNGWLCSECERCVEGDGIDLCSKCELCEYCCKCYETQYYTKTFDSGDYTFGYDDNSTWVVLVGYKGSAKTVEIPSVVENDGRRYRVRIIGSAAFRGNTTIEKISVPAGVDQINSGAFANTRFTDIWMYPSYQQGMFNDMFNGNTSLSRIHVPSKYLTGYQEQFPNHLSKLRPVNHMVRIDGFYWSIDEATRTATLERGDEGIKEALSDPLIIPGTIEAYGRNYVVTRLGEMAVPTYCKYWPEQNEVVIPASVKSMAKYPVDETDGYPIQYLWMMGTEPPMIDGNVEEEDGLAYTVYMPFGAEEKYESHPQWMNYMTFYSSIPIAVGSSFFTGEFDIYKNRYMAYLASPLGGYPKGTEICIPATFKYKGKTFTTARNTVLEENGVVSFVDNTGHNLFGFRNCANLESIVSNGDVVSNFTIENCPKLKSIRLSAITPPRLYRPGEPIWKNFDPSKVILEVPIQSVDAYKSSDCWKDFNIVGYTIGSFDNIEIAGLKYNLDGESRKATLTGGADGKLPSQVIVPATITYNGTSYDVATIAKGALVSNDVTELRLCRTQVPELGDNASASCINVPNANVYFSASSHEKYQEMLSTHGAKYRRYWLWGDGSVVPRGYVLSNDDMWDERVCVVSTDIDGTYAGWRGDVVISDEIYFEPEDEYYTVDEIPAKTFYNNRQITSVSLGRNIVSIGLNAFQACKNLKTIYVRRSKFAPHIDPTGVTNHGIAEFLPNGVIVYVPTGSTARVQSGWTLWNPNILEYREMNFGGNTSGDVNADEKLDMADVQELMPMMLYPSPKVITNRAADVNRDGKINAEDLSMLYYYQHSYTFKDFDEDPEVVTRKQGPKVRLCLSKREAERYTFDINLDNAGASIDNLSFLICLPKGANIIAATATADRSAEHKFWFRKIEDPTEMNFHSDENVYFVSIDNASSLTPFQKSTGSVGIFTVTCDKSLEQASHKVSLSDVRGFHLKERETSQQKDELIFYGMEKSACFFSNVVPGNDDDAIHGIRETHVCGHAYDLSGRHAAHQHKGHIYIQDSKKVLK